MSTSSVVKNLAAVQEAIRAACTRAGRSPQEVTLVAVSKTQSIEVIAQAMDAGIRHFGENRVQEAAPKIEALEGREVVWHMVGHLQSNKAGRAVELFDLIHSIDSEELAEEVGRRARARGKTQPVLLQVNCSGESTKSGCSPEHLVNLARLACRTEGLAVRGLMTIGPLDPNPESARSSFRLLNQLKRAAQDSLGIVLPELSMGMTQDLGVAVEEGATIVRVGTALFGQRPDR